MRRGDRPPSWCPSCRSCLRHGQGPGSGKISDTYPNMPCRDMYAASRTRLIAHQLDYSASEHEDRVRRKLGQGNGEILRGTWANRKKHINVAGLREETRLNQWKRS